MELISVAAVAENGVIGRDGELPWHLPGDSEQYRERVAGDPVILGRRTFESMLDDLPGTAQVVLSRSEQSFDVPTAHHAGGVEEALAVLESLGAERAYVLGGEAIYELFQPHLDRMALTRVPGEYEGDATYPAFDDGAWTLAETIDHGAFVVEVYDRTGN